MVELVKEVPSQPSSLKQTSAHTHVHTHTYAHTRARIKGLLLATEREIDR